MKIFFPDIHSKPLLFKIMPIDSHSSARQHYEDPHTVFSVTSPEALEVAAEPLKAISSPGSTSPAPLASPLWSRPPNLCQRGSSPLNLTLVC